MTEIPKKYIVDEHNKKVGVQLDIATFEKIEEIPENHGLVEPMKQTEGEEKLAAAKATAYYRTPDKAQ